jgi:hypothetical protein
MLCLLIFVNEPVSNYNKKTDLQVFKSIYWQYSNLWKAGGATNYPMKAKQNERHPI